MSRTVRPERSGNVTAGGEAGRRPAGHPALMGSTYEINSADVVCGNVQTANATVYIINTVLMPPSS